MGTGPFDPLNPFHENRYCPTEFKGNALFWLSLPGLKTLVSKSIFYRKVAVLMSVMWYVVIIRIEGTLFISHHYVHNLWLLSVKLFQKSAYNCSSVSPFCMIGSIQRTSDAVWPILELSPARRFSRLRWGECPPGPVHRLPGYEFKDRNKASGASRRTYRIGGGVGWGFQQCVSVARLTSPPGGHDRSTQHTTRHQTHRQPTKSTDDIKGNLATWTSQKLIPKLPSS